MKYKRTVDEGEARRDSSYALCLCTLLLFLVLFGFFFIGSKVYMPKHKENVPTLYSTHDSSAMKREKIFSKTTVFETTSSRVKTKHDMTSQESFTTSSTINKMEKLLPVTTTTKVKNVLDESLKESSSPMQMTTTSNSPSTVKTLKISDSPRKSPKYSLTKNAFTRNIPLTVKTTGTTQSMELATQTSENSELTTDSSENSELTTHISESSKLVAHSFESTELTTGSSENSEQTIHPAESSELTTHSSENSELTTSELATSSESSELTTNPAESSELTTHPAESSELTTHSSESSELATQSSKNERTTDMSSYSIVQLTREPTEIDTGVSSLRPQSSSEAITTFSSEGNSYTHKPTTVEIESTSNSEIEMTSSTFTTRTTPDVKELSLETSEPTTYLSKGSSSESSSVDITKKDIHEILSSESTSKPYSTSYPIATSIATSEEHEITTTTKTYKKEHRKIPVRLPTTEKLLTTAASKIAVPLNNSTDSAIISSEVKASTTPTNKFEEGAIIFEDDVESFGGTNKTTKREKYMHFGDLKLPKNETTSSATIRSTMNCSSYCAAAVPTCPVCEVPDCPEIPTSTPQPVTTSKPEPKVCRTSQCQVMAGRILSLVNISVDPCEDFYSYSCGGIVDNPTLLEEDMTTDVWNRIEEAVLNVSSESPASYRKFKNYYEGCVKYDTLVSMDSRREQGRSVLDSVAPFLDVLSSPDDEFVDLLIKFFKLGSAPLFRIQLDVDSVNSSRFQLVISPPDWLSSHFLTPEEKSKRCRHKTTDRIPLNTQEAFTAYENCMRNVSEFLETMEKALEFFQIFNHLPSYNSSQLIQEIRMSVELDFLDLLSKYPPRSNIEKDKQFKNYKLWSKIKLDTDIPSISWGYLLSSLLNVEIQDTTNVQIYFSEQITEFLKQVASKNARTMQNLMMAVLAHDLYTELVVTHDACDRGRYCLRVAASLMPSVASNLYLATFTSHHINQTRKQAVQIYTQFVTEMEENLKTASWLDANSMSEVTNKLRFMAIQFPPILNESQLHDTLGECPLTDMQYLKDSICLIKQFQVQVYSRYSLDPHFSQAMWPHFLTSFSTETVFIYGLNTYMVPQAVLSEYDSHMPRHVVMARLGFLLARGIAHNFDQTGVKYTAGGKFGQMLSESSYPWYQEVVDTSNSLFSFTRSRKEGQLTYEYLLDPELTLNQRLADITAANLAQISAAKQLDDYHLLWVPFSQEQLFYITLAQTFCSKKKMPEIYTTLYEGTTLLPFVRVFNIASSSEKFAFAFKCPQGAPMNLQDLMKTRPFPLFQTEEVVYD